jgi:hypothetical protein
LSELLLKLACRILVYIHALSFDADYNLIILFKMNKLY